MKDMNGFMSHKRSGPKLGSGSKCGHVAPKNDGPIPNFGSFLTATHAKPNKGFVNKASKLS